MKVIKIGQKYILWTFWGFLVTIICDVNLLFVNLLHCPGVWFFNIRHLFDNLTSFDIFYLWGGIYCGQVMYLCLGRVPTLARECTFLGNLTEYFSLESVMVLKEYFSLGGCATPVKICQVVKNMSNIKRSNIWTMEEVHTKSKLTQWWGSHILMSIFMSDMKVIKIGQKYLLWSFWGFFLWWSYVTSNLTSICVKLIMAIYFFVNLLHSPGVCVFLTFVIFFDSFIHCNIRSNIGSTYWFHDCKFLNTPWILTKFLLVIDIEVFYLNIVVFPWWLEFKKLLFDFNWFQHIGSITSFKIFPFKFWDL